MDVLPSEWTDRQHVTATFDSAFLNNVFPQGFDFRRKATAT